MRKNNISFILHKPQLSENIGACARAIKNFNFKKLVLINPKPIYPNDKILATSVGARDIIKHCKKYDNLEKELSSGKIDTKLFAKKSKEYSSLGNVISYAREFVRFESEKNDTKKY